MSLSVVDALDWRKTLRLAWVTARGEDSALLPLSCPRCLAAELWVMEDPTSLGGWAACRACAFSGDHIELFARLNQIEAEDAIAILSFAGCFRLAPDLSRAQAYVNGELGRRQRVNAFWRESQQRPLLDMTRAGVDLLQRCSLDKHAWDYRWEEREARLFGVADIQAVRRLVAATRHRRAANRSKQANVASKYKSEVSLLRRVERGGDGEVFVVPHFDLPGRIVGFTFIGGNADRDAGDVFYHSVASNRSRRQTIGTGFAMLPAIGFDEPKVFVFTELTEAMLLHAHGFLESEAPLPVVAVEDAAILEHCPLPPPLADRQLVFCGPLEQTLPLARLHAGLASESSGPALRHALSDQSPSVVLECYADQARPAGSELPLNPAAFCGK